MGFDEVGRGCARTDLCCNREPGFFAIGIEKFFSFRADWHQDDRVNPLVRQYQAALDSVLASHPELSDCAVHCVHCGIRFLTHPRNARRVDLRCPFGCQGHHRRQCSSQRSTAYYQTACGKAKKKRLNARRCAPPPPRGAEEVASPVSAPGPPLPPAEPSAAPSPAPPSLPAELALPGVVLDEASVTRSPLLPYVQMLLSLLEGVALSRQDLVELLCRSLRQHSFARRRRADYVLAYWQQHPP